MTAAANLKSRKVSAIHYNKNPNEHKDWCAQACEGCNSRLSAGIANCAQLRTRLCESTYIPLAGSRDEDGS
jgi:hypothetical protein